MDGYTIRLSGGVGCGSNKAQTAWGRQGYSEVAPLGVNRIVCPTDQAVTNSYDEIYLYKYLGTVRKF